jgi:hypothetical protein
MFMTLSNAGEDDDELLDGRAQICADIQLRRNSHYDDPPLKSFPLPAGATLVMTPQGSHLRLMGLRHRLEPAMRFPLILDFLNAGEIEINVEVAFSAPS